MPTISHESRFPGESASLSDVLDELRTLPFLAKARVVIVENADPFITAHRRELETYAERPATTGVLVLAVKSWPGEHEAGEAGREGGDLGGLQIAGREGPAAMARLLAKAKAGVVLELDAAELMVELVGPEVGLLAMEVEKLATYVGTRKRIARDDVETMVDAGRVQQDWAALESATTGQGEAALVVIDRLLAAKEAPQKMIAALSSSLLKTYHAGMLRREDRGQGGVSRGGHRLSESDREHDPPARHLGPWPRGQAARDPAPCRPGHEGSLAALSGHDPRTAHRGTPRPRRGCTTSPQPSLAGHPPPDGHR